MTFQVIMFTDLYDPDTDWYIWLIIIVDNQMIKFAQKKVNASRTDLCLANVYFKYNYSIQNMMMARGCEGEVIWRD